MDNCLCVGLLFMSFSNVPAISTTTAPADATALAQRVTTTDNAFCPVNWTKYGMSCYLHITDTLNFTLAQERCESLEADVVSISSDEENMAINGLSSGSPNIWLALERTGPCSGPHAGTCTWQLLGGSNVLYTNWDPGAAATFSECAVMIPSGQWTNSRLCNDEAETEVVCEQSVQYPTTTTEPTTTEEVKTTTNPDPRPVDVGLIAGVTVTAVVVVVIIVVVVGVILKKKSRKNKVALNTPSNSHAA